MLFQEEVMFQKREVVSINFTFKIVSFMLPKPPPPLSAEGGGVKSYNPIDAFWT